MFDRNQSTQHFLRFISVLIGGLLFAAPAVAAFEFAGTKTVSVVTADGSELLLGEIDFAPSANGNTEFKLNLDIHKFTDYFLSMKEFKCIPADAEVTCHVPYPYKSPTTVSAENLVWLEHRLMFLFKKPKEFGAKLWNGIYFELQEQDDILVGTPKAIDLNDISAPPEDLNTPPYTGLNTHDMPIKERWVQQLKIQG